MDLQKEREVFEEWVDSEFNDHNWYLESKDHRNLHQYREELNDYWQYEETLLWSAWQADKAIPDGFVVVPRELTEATKQKMMRVFHESDKFLNCNNMYSAMIAAAQEQSHD